MKKTIKKIVAVTVLASMAFGFGAGIQSSQTSTQAAELKPTALLRDPGHF
ncbi:hypothetical protein QU577_26940 [Priestia megaterium]|nr:hypothetical protein [Priestia megaterium]MDN3365403.1 hypothetical protein [Priestia megaterium]